MIHDDTKTSPELELARNAAKAFGSNFEYLEAEIQQLDNPPLYGPTALERGGRRVHAYRWVGGGRGASYVQVEIDPGSLQVTVYGSSSHKEFGPWEFELS